MNTATLGVVANIAAVLGILICAAAGIGRILGFYHVLDFQTITLFIGGTSLMVFSGVIKLHRIESMLSERS